MCDSSEENNVCVCVLTHCMCTRSRHGGAPAGTGGILGPAISMEHGCDGMPAAKIRNNKDEGVGSMLHLAETTETEERHVRLCH